MSTVRGMDVDLPGRIVNNPGWPHAQRSPQSGREERDPHTR